MFLSLIPPILIAALAVLLFLAFTVLIRLRLGQPARAMPYLLRPHFLTDNERAFHIALQEACGPQFKIFAQVRLADLLEPINSFSDLNKVAGKNLDFIICDAETYNVVAGVEVDDRTHRKSRRRARDAFVGSVCGHIGLPLVRFPAARGYDPARIRQQLPFSNPVDIPPAARLA